MEKSGTIITARKNSLTNVTRTEAGNWIFFSKQGECDQCTSCSNAEVSIQLDKMMAALPDSGGFGSNATVGDVVLGIKASQINSVLWHTLLFPLSGFLAGASIGMILFAQDLASAILAGMGVVAGLLATRPLDPNVVYIEPVSKSKHPELRH